MNDITVHIDPEDDETASPSNGLPSRNEIMAMVYPEIQKTGISEDIRNILLHYINGQVEIEIYLSSNHEQEKLQALTDACKSCNDVRSVTVYQKITA